MKKFLGAVVVLMVIAVVALPTISLAADQWGIGVGSGGVSGVYSGNNGSIGISSGFGGSSSYGSSGGWSVGRLGSFGLPAGSITGIIVNILDWLLMIFGMVGVIGFIISGVMYLVAAGDEKTMETAKNAMKYSIIGVLVGLSGVVIIRAIDAILAVGYTI